MEPSSGGNIITGNSSSTQNSGNHGGITQAIRTHLGFNDDKKWKQFSTRRLELIDKFNLSYKKASEQDDSIKQIANLLRIEFGFPMETLMDFDKLVRAAIQSVRRNRKRSSRSRLHTDRFILNEKLEQQSIHNKMGVNSLLSNNIVHTTTTTTTSSTADTTPSTSHPTSPTPPPQLPPIKNITTLSISHFNKNKLLQSIENSKTCALISNNDPNLHMENLITLGQAIISSSASFVLERFFQDLSNDSVNYLYQQITSIPTIAKILKNLGVITTELIKLSDFQSSQLLSKLLGGIIKDFGFDSITYDLAEIFHEIILNQYPLIATQVEKFNSNTLMIPTLSVVPKEADKELQKNVKLKYGERILNFIYKPISTKPPTIMEIKENGKIAFGIAKELNLISLGRNDGSRIKDDEELEKLFKDQDDLELEILIVNQGVLNISSLL